MRNNAVQVRPRIDDARQIFNAIHFSKPSIQWLRNRPAFLLYQKVALAILLPVMALTGIQAQAQTAPSTQKKIFFVELDDLLIPIVVSSGTAGTGGDGTGGGDGTNPPSGGGQTPPLTSPNDTGTVIASNFLYQPGTGRLYAWRYGNGLPRMHTFDSNGRVEKIDTPTKHTLSFGYFNTDTIQTITQSAQP